MKKLSSRAHYKRFCTYGEKTFKFPLSPEELSAPAKYKSYSPANAISAVFSGLITGKNSALQIEKHLENINHKLGKVSTRCRSTIGSLLDEDRSLTYLNNYLLSLLKTCHSLRALKLDEFGSLVVAFVDGIDLGEVHHAGGKCELCLERHHKSGEVRYFHKVVILSVMSKYGPIPIYFRFVRETELTIKHGDSSEERFKQECELSCTRKILMDLAGKFGSRLPFDILGGDALFANAPFMELVESLGAAGVFVFNQENRKLYKQAKADFSGQSLGFNISQESWKNSYSKGRFFDASWGFYVDVNRKNQNKNVRIFETIRTEKDGKKSTGMAITTDRRFLTPQIVEVVRAGKWHDLENGVFNELVNNWGTLKHIFFHLTNAMQSMIALQLICLVISLFYRFANLKRGGRKFTGTLKDFFDQTHTTFVNLKRKGLSDLMCNSPPWA